jgi:hypothetical protein
MYMSQSSFMGIIRCHNLCNETTHSDHAESNSHSPKLRIDSGGGGAKSLKYPTSLPLSH